MTDVSLQDVAKVFGVSVARDGAITTWERDGLTVRIRAPFDTRHPEGRHRAACVAWGLRLGVDRRRCAYDFTEERPDSEGARNVYERASIYGERLQQLVPTPALDLAETVAGVELFRRPWLNGALAAELVLIRETGRRFHTLAEPDFEALEYSRENMVEYARYALFYDAYKFRPHTTDRHEWGRLKWFRTHDGQAAARATLLPDFDYDAARARGAAVVLGRDALVIAQPDEDRERTLRELQDAATDVISETVVPFSRRVLFLEADAIEPGPNLQNCASFDSSRIEPVEVRDTEETD